MYPDELLSCCCPHKDPPESLRIRLPRMPESSPVFHSHYMPDCEKVSHT